MSDAPRCYQTAFAYGEKNAVCQACPCVAECAPVATERRAAILKTVGANLTAKQNETASEPIGDAPKQEVIVQPKPAPTPPAMVKEPAPAVETPKIDGVSKKGLELIRAISKVTADLPGEIKTGRNPFEHAKPGYMKVVCSLLLAGNFHKKQLHAALKDQLAWSDGSASSHVSIVASALPALGVVTIDNEVFKVAA